MGITESLECHAGDRFQRFKGFKTGHPRLNKAEDTLTRLIREPGGAGIIFVIGPSGAGKTTLYNKVKPKLENIFKDAFNPGQIPVAAYEAPAPSCGQFNWSHNNINCLKALKDPITLRNSARHDLFGVSFAAKERRSELELQLSVESALKYRKTKVLMIDEGHHLAIIGSGRRLRDQTEFIKSMCNMNDVTFVLFGTYDLLLLTNLNGQLANRSAVIHFPRYDARKQKEREQFLNVVCTFQQKMPFDKKPDLEANWQFLYERSVGCIGTLKQWLDRAIQAALDANAKGLTMKHLQDTALSTNQCIRALKDAYKGEIALLETEEKETKLQELLWDDGFPSPEEEPPRSPRQCRRPGQSNPKRVKVG